MQKHHYKTIFKNYNNLICYLILSYDITSRFMEITRAQEVTGTLLNILDMLEVF